MKIRYNRTNVYSIAGIRLLPGVNMVDDKAWKAVADHPAVKSRMKMGAIVVDGGVELSADDVAEMTNVEDLRAIAEGDSRKAEVKAAKKRLAEIDAMAKEGDTE